MRVRISLIAAMILACGSPALADSAAPLVGAAAYGDWRGDAPGVRRKLTPADMPPPLSSEPVANPSRLVARPKGAQPKAPPGFVVDVFASGLAQPRVVRVAPNGDIFVAESGAGRVRAFRASDGAAPAKSEVFASGLHRPFGVAFYPPGPDPRWVYVASTSEVVRYPYRPGELTAFGPAETVVASLPSGGFYWTRDIAFSPDGKTLFVSVGSNSNVAETMPEGQVAKNAPLGAAWGPEQNRADLLAFHPDGSGMRIFATGLRNCSGLTVQPETSALWCAVNERDILGDNLPPD